MPVVRHSATLTFASNAASATIVGAIGLVRDAFVDYGTVDGTIAVTIKDSTGKDILNGVGTGIAADTLYTQADMGGTANAGGSLTVAGSGTVTDTKACVVYITVVS